MRIIVELTSATASVRRQIRNLLLAAPVTITSDVEPAVPPDSPAVLWYQAVTGRMHILVDNVWVAFGGINSTLSATPPYPPGANDEWVDANTMRAYIWNGTAWVEKGTVNSAPSLRTQDVVTQDYTLTGSDVGTLLRFLFEVPAPTVSRHLLLPVQPAGVYLPSTFLLNKPTTGNLIVSGDTGVTVTETIIPPGTSAQLVYVGSQQWEVLL